MAMNWRSCRGILRSGMCVIRLPGEILLENVQPLLSISHRGTLAMVHNGQIVNAIRLRNEMEDAGSIFQGTSDSEIILHLIQRQKGSLLEKIKQTARQLDGAFAFLIMSENSVYAVRDPHGLRPLSYARVQEGYCISSGNVYVRCDQRS